MEVKEVLCRYYVSKMDTMLEEMWDSGEFDQQRLDEINEMDLHQVMRE